MSVFVYPHVQISNGGIARINKWKNRDIGFLLLKVFEGFIDPFFSRIMKCNLHSRLKSKKIGFERSLIHSDKKLLYKMKYDSYNCVISIGPRILDTRFFQDNLPPILNLHGALLPKFGGLGNEFWIRFLREDSFSCTLHLMSSQLDSGKILEFESRHLEESWSIFRTNVETSKLAGKLLSDFLNNISSVSPIFRNIKSQNLNPKVKLRSFPNREQSRELRNRGIKLISYRDLGEVYCGH